MKTTLLLLLISASTRSDYSGNEQGFNLRNKRMTGNWNGNTDTDVVILKGGCGTENSVELLDPLGLCKVQLPSFFWSPEPERGDHFSHYSTTSEGRLYLCSIKSSCLAMVTGVSLSGVKTWARGGELRQGRRNACGVATSNATFIVIGGLDDGGAPISNVEEYNTVTGTRRSRAAMPGGGRNNHKCFNIGRDVLVVGGYGEGGELDSALLYRVDANSWRTVAKMQKSNGEMVVVNGRILYLGGSNENGDAVDTIEEFDQDRESWTILDTRLNIPRYGFTASVMPRGLLRC